MSFFKFPYTSFQQINLDWIMKTLNQVKDAIPLVQQASTIYNQALEALTDANEAVETVTDQAAAAVSTANAAQAVAGQANTTAVQANTAAAQANTTAQSAETTAQSASDISATARETAITALANSNQALNIATWVFINQYDIKDAENHRDITTPAIDITDLKSGLLLEIVDHYSCYGYGTISFPALSLRGEIENYYGNDNYHSFYYSPLGSQTALRLFITVTHTINAVGGQTRHYVQFRFRGNPSANTLASTDCYINIYRC